mmetsp:Transcript_15086/g.45064  ORF Transcript_15086/g.45064 Transcript_15086/m.45064 type:complete len:82 (-) Transcript_15086:2523-2768(-)
MPTRRFIAAATRRFYQADPALLARPNEYALDCTTLPFRVHHHRAGHDEPLFTMLRSGHQELHTVRGAVLFSRLSEDRLEEP